MLEYLRFGICALLLLSGTAVACISVLGVFRFGYALNRIHAAGMLDSLALMLIMLGCAAGAADSVIAVKLMIALLFQWITSPVSGHLIGRLIYQTDRALPTEASIWKS